MDKKIRMTIPTMRVLELFLARQNEGLSGAEIAKSTNLLSGSLYPILHRLERCGWLSSEQEDIDPVAEGRPRRRFYKIKGEAQIVALDALNSRGYFTAPPGILGGANVLA